MALTITQQPSTFLQSANNDSYYIVSGSTYALTGITDYKYVADLYVNSILSCTLKSFPDPTYGVGQFNLRNIMSAFISYDFPIVNDNTQVFHLAPNSYANVQLQFREEYVSGITFVQPTGSTASNSFVYINSALDFIDQINITLSPYVLTTSTIGKFLQTKTDYIAVYNRAYSLQRNWLSYYTQVNAAAGLRVITRDIGLNILNSYFITNPYSAQSGIQIVGVGMPELFSSVSFTNVAYYDVALVVSASGSTISESVRYKIYESCGKFANEAYKLYWLGEFGEWDSWYFTKKSETTVNRTSSTYKKTQGKLGTGGTFTINTYDAATNQYYTSLQDSIAISTEFLSDSDVMFLKSCFTSPKVYYETITGQVFACTIKDDSYVLNKVVNSVGSKSYALVLTIEPAFNNYRQQL